MTEQGSLGADAASRVAHGVLAKGVRELALGDVTNDPDVQVRQLHEPTVRAYTELEENGTRLPPVDAVEVEDGRLLLVNGGHRVEARRRAGFETVRVRLRPGTFRDAVLAAVQANATNGRSLTRKEKRATVQKLLSDPEWAKVSDRRIAKWTGTSRPFVAALRRGTKSQVRLHELGTSSSLTTGTGPKGGNVAITGAPVPMGNQGDSESEGGGTGLPETTIDRREESQLIHKEESQLVREEEPQAAAVWDLATTTEGVSGDTYVVVQGSGNDSGAGFSSAHALDDEEDQFDIARPSAVNPEDAEEAVVDSDPPELAGRRPDDDFQSWRGLRRGYVPVIVVQEPGELLRVFELGTGCVRVVAKASVEPDEAAALLHMFDLPAPLGERVYQGTSGDVRVRVEVAASAVPGTETRASGTNPAQMFAQQLARDAEETAAWIDNAETAASTRDGVACGTDGAALDREMFEERAAIAEYDGCLPREQAEALAVEEAEERRRRIEQSAIAGTADRASDDPAGPARSTNRADSS